MKMVNSADAVIASIKETLQEFLPKAVKAAEMLDADITDQLSMTLDIFPVFLDEKQKLGFLPTGTQAKPKGIAVHKGRLIAIFNNKGLIKLMTREDFRSVVKTKTDIFSRGVGPDFETMGIIIDIPKATEYFNDELLFV